MSETVRDAEVVAIGPKSGLRYVHLHARWVDELEALEHASFPTADHEDIYDAESIADLAADFPEGCFVGFDGETAVATGYGVRTDFDLDHPQHTIHDLFEWNELPSGHDPDGDWYYGTDIAVSPTHRRRGIGHELYDLRKGVCREMNLRGIVAGGVIPGYADHKHEMTAEEYVAKVRSGELYDRTLTFQLENGFDAPSALAGYIRDPAVNSWASLIVWHNPDLREPPGM